MAATTKKKDRPQLASNRAVRDTEIRRSAMSTPTIDHQTSTVPENAPEPDPREGLTLLRERVEQVSEAVTPEAGRPDRQAEVSALFAELRRIDAALTAEAEGEKRLPYWWPADLTHPEWCSGHHKDEDPVADRNCWSEWEARVVLTQHDATVTHHDADTTVDKVERHYVYPIELCCHVWQEHREFAPLVEVGPEATEDGSTYRLTRDEAEQLARALDAAVALIDGRQPGDAR